MSARSRACEFDKRARQYIMERDYGCIFCRMEYHMEDTTEYGRSNFQIMHYIGRAHGGLGIPQNGAIGCLDHHRMMDNGSSGRGKEMRELMKGYLKKRHLGWEEEKLVFKK